MPKVDKLLKEWSESVKERDGRKCVICGDPKLPNSHHIIVKSRKFLKYDIDNGLTLCPTHHRFSHEISPHTNPLPFFMWMTENRPEQLKTLKEKWNKHSS